MKSLSCRIIRRSLAGSDPDAPLPNGFAEHLDRCESCRRELDARRRTRRLVEWYAARPVASPNSESFGRRAILHRVRESEAQRRDARPALGRGVAVAAALLAAAVGIAGGIHHYRFEKNGNPAPVFIAKVSSPVPSSAVAPQTNPAVTANDGHSLPIAPSLSPFTAAPAAASADRPPTGSLGTSSPSSQRNAGFFPRTRGSESVKAQGRTGSDPVDDLRYANQLPSERPAIRGAAPGRIGDDFITIPRPQIAASDSPKTDAIVADAVSDYEKEQAVVDDRLAQKVDVELKGGDLHELMAELTAKTGVRFYADKAYEDVKLSVFIKDQPVRDLMRQVARLFNFEWHRYGETGKYRYQITQSLKERLAEEEEKRQDVDQMLLDVTGQMEKYLPYKDKSPAELNAMADDAQRKAQTAGSVEEREEDLNQMRMFSALGDGKGRDLLNVYSSMSPDQLIALQNGDPVVLQFNGDGSASTLQRDYAERIRAAALQEFSPGGEWARPDRLEWALTPIENEQVTMTFRLDRTRLDQSLLSATYEMESHLPDDPSAGRKGGGSSGGFNWGMTPLVIGQPDRMRNPANDAAHADLNGQPEWQTPVNLHPQAEAAPAPGPWTQDLLNRPASSVTPTAPGKDWIDSGDFFATLHQKTGRNLVADYYTRVYTPGALSSSGKTILKALDDAADLLKSSWTQDGDFLRFRRFNSYSERSMDIPNRLLTRWAADRKRLGGPTLDDLAEMAAFPDGVLQHTDLGRALLLKYGLDEWPLAFAARAELRFFATLTPVQRQRALTSAGLPFATLTPEQLQAAQTATRHSDPFTDDEIRHGRFLARLQAPGTYEWFEGRHDASNPIPIAVTLHDTTREGIEVQIAARVRANGGDASEIEQGKRGVRGPGAAVLTRFDYGDQFFARETLGSRSVVLSPSGGSKE